MAEKSPDEILAGFVGNLREEERFELLEDVLKLSPFNRLEANIRVDKPNYDVTSLYHLEPCPVETEYRPVRDLSSGEVVAFEEVAINGVQESLSMRRRPTADQTLMGSTSNYPFLPGGMEFDLDRLLAAEESENDAHSNLLEDLDDDSALLTTPPGFANGVKFSSGAPKAEIAEQRTAVDTSTGSVATEADDFFDMMDLLDSVPLNPPSLADQSLDQLNCSSIMITETPIETAENSSESKDDAEELESIVSSAPKVIRLDANAKVKGKVQPNVEVFAVALDSQSPCPDYAALDGRRAREWPFTLDHWQERAVVCLERGESVFVAAHTSAGKTVVAEYAVALCRRHRTRVVYTSPIKALSNQKFRDFRILFDDVGLVTGDIQLQPQAFCLIMTTEILRSMLYNGSEVVRELEWVIFDEVHYVNDSERGVVWEEVLIMLPSHVKIVMLSATAPNSMEFADWVGRIKNRKIYVISTLKRPVPLEHYLYTGMDGKTKDNRFLIVDQFGKFQMNGYNKAVQSKVQSKSTATGAKPNFRGPRNAINQKTERNMWVALLGHLRARELLPVVAFTLSRRRCDDNALMLTNTDLTTADDKRHVHHFFSRCVNRLSPADRRLPQVLQLQDLCKRGIAVHHSGILPILKEVVEMLFQQGYVRILFATETFSMGVNMPARTVIFDNMRKHDGKQMRDLLPGEYVQMAGRAGRRGIDSTGTVILLCKTPDLPPSNELHHMMLGQPTKLQSQFRVTYSMLLNLLRVQQLKVEDVLQRSYVESASLRMGASWKEQLVDVRAEIAQFPSPDCAVCLRGRLLDYYDACRRLIRLRMHLWQTMMKLSAVAKMLTPGRVLLFSRGATIRRRPALLLKISSTDDGQKRFTLLLPISQGEQSILLDEKTVKESEEEKEWAAETCDLWDLCFPADAQSSLSDLSTQAVLSDVGAAAIQITTKQLKANVSAILQDDERRSQPRFRRDPPDGSVTQTQRELAQLAQTWAATGAPTIQPGKDVQSNDLDTVDAFRRLSRDETSLAAFDCIHCLSFREHLTSVRERSKLEEAEKRLQFRLSDASLFLKPEFECKMKVLRAMGYIDANNLVQLKGKVACEIHQHELLITELLLENKLSALSSAEIAAVLSCTTCQFKSGDGRLDDENLKALRETTMATADRICAVQRDCGVMDNDLSVDLRFDLIDVVYEWARGVPFAQLMPLTGAQEGLIVRCIQRLDEVCRDVRNAARIVGDPMLQQKMEDTSTAIKRDIVFAASLYTVT